MNDKLELMYDDSEDVCLSIEKDDNKEYPFEIAVDARDGFERMLLTTAEAKALLKFLKKHLEPKLENV